jgi:hypothetical protein
MRMPQNERRQPFFKVALLFGRWCSDTNSAQEDSARRHAFLREINDQFIGRSIDRSTSNRISGEGPQGKKSLSLYLNRDEK